MTDAGRDVGGQSEASDLVVNQLGVDAAFGEELTTLMVASGR
jgi:hypothetical protein